MPKPEEPEWRAAKRLARYLKDHRRVVLEYKHQESARKVVVWSDTYRRMRDDSEINVRRSRHARFVLLEDGQPDAGDDRCIFWGGGVIRHRESGDDGEIKSTFKDMGLEWRFKQTRIQVPRGVFHLDEARGEFDMWRCEAVGAGQGSLRMVVHHRGAW